jgi:hypothetical protein
MLPFSQLTKFTVSIYLLVQKLFTAYYILEYFLIFNKYCKPHFKSGSK